MIRILAGLFNCCRCLRAETRLRAERLRAEHGNMARYLQILSVQNPFTIGLDSIKRVQFSCNYDLRSDGPVARLEEEVVKILSDAGQASSGVDTWIGPAVMIPTGSGAVGPYTLIINTGGYQNRETHNGDVQQNHSVQIIVTAADYIVARNKSNSIWSVLHGKRNVDVVL